MRLDYTTPKQLYIKHRSIHKRSLKPDQIKYLDSALAEHEISDTIANLLITHLERSKALQAKAWSLSKVTKTRTSP